MEIQGLPIFKINKDDNSPNQTRRFGVHCPNLAPLKQDTVSFKGTVFKKSDFQGIDLAVIEKYKPNIQQFKSKDDLQTFAENKINELKEKDFGGRQEETKVQRKAMLKEWFDYVTKENDAYSNTQRLVILSAITKDLKANNDNIPEVLNKGVLAQTVTELEDRLKANPKDNFDFLKMYKNNLRADFMTDSETGETMTGWVVIPSKENDSENFEKNVEKLKTLSHKSWCTKSFNAEPYLSQGDFHVYLENGEPKLGVRFVGDKVQEIQGERNNGKIPVKYLDVFKSHQNDFQIKLRENAQSEVDKAEKTKEQVSDFLNKYGDNFKIKNIDDAKLILKTLGIDVIDKTERPFSMRILSGKLINSEKNEDELLCIASYPNRNSDITCEDLNVNENDLFKFIEEIQGPAAFTNSNVTNLGNLKRIGGLADFVLSEVKNLGKLESIEGNAYFTESKIENLGNLEYIGRYADFMNSQVKDLGNLQEIGGNLKLVGSHITNLGKLKIIGGNVDFSNTPVEDLGELEEIIGNAKFSNSNIKSLGNLKKICCDADFRYSDITDLGKLEYIGNNADFSYSKIEDLSNLKHIGGNLDLSESKVNKLCNFNNILGDIKHNDDSMELFMQFEEDEILAYAEDDFKYAETPLSNKDDDDLDDNERIWQMIEQG